MMKAGSGRSPLEGQCTLNLLWVAPSAWTFCYGASSAGHVHGMFGLDRFGEIGFLGMYATGGGYEIVDRYVVVDKFAVTFDFLVLLGLADIANVALCSVSAPSVSSCVLANLVLSAREGLRGMVDG